jgi:hypothetical protein
MRFLRFHAVPGIGPGLCFRFLELLGVFGHPGVFGFRLGLAVLPGGFVFSEVRAAGKRVGLGVFVCFFVLGLCELLGERVDFLFAQVRIRAPSPGRLLGVRCSRLRLEGRVAFTFPPFFGCGSFSRPADPVFGRFRFGGFRLYGLARFGA